MTKTATAEAEPIVEQEILPPMPTAISVYSPMAAALADWKKDDEGKTFHYDEPEDDKAARSHVYKLRQIRARVEEARKAANEQARVHIANVNEAANPLKDEITKLIDRHQVEIDAAEQRKKDAEALLEAKVQAVKKAGELDGAATVAQVEAAQVALEGMAIDESFGDREEEARTAKAAATMMLDMHLVRARRAEADAVELEALRADKAARDAEDIRKAGIQNRLSALQEFVALAKDAQPHHIRSHIASVEELVVDQSFGERQVEAEGIRATVLENLRAALTEAVERASQAERDRLAQEEVAEAGRKREAEAAAQRAADAAVEAERKRVADQKAADDAAAEKRAKNTARQKKVNGEALDAMLEANYGGEGIQGDVLQKYGEALCKAIIAAIARGMIPHVTIIY